MAKPGIARACNCGRVHPDPPRPQFGRSGHLGPVLDTIEEVDVADQRTDTDVIDELTTDHREALELLDRIMSSTDPEERRELADTVISEIVRHSVSDTPPCASTCPTARRPSHTTPKNTSSSKRS